VRLSNTRGGYSPAAFRASKEVEYARRVFCEAYTRSRICMRRRVFLAVAVHICEVGTQCVNHSNALSQHNERDMIIINLSIYTDCSLSCSLNEQHLFVV